MADIEINDLASLGVIRGIEGHQLPPEAFTLGNNMRFIDDGVERIGGASQIFGTPLDEPHFLLPISSPSQTFWLYVSLTRAFVFDGSTHTDITRTSGIYNASDTRAWNGTLLSGVPILNNGADAPQYWSSLNPLVKLADLPNWPANTTAEILRAFGPYLVALNVRKGGSAFPHMVKWSHPADPGSIPSSWDETDETKDAGEKDLPDVNAGLIREAMRLGGRLFIYKDSSTWKMIQIGGQFIFDFDTFLETSGILGPRCVALTGDGLRHVVATQDDIIVHNGNSAESILDERFKRYLVNNIDNSNYLNSFMYTDPFNNEVIFCYPESGSIHPNKALVWNYKVGKKGCISERELVINFRNVAISPIETSLPTVWDSVSTAWDDMFGGWSTSQRRKLVLCATSSTKFLQAESSVKHDGVDFLGTLQRTGLSMIGRKRTGEWIVDFKKRKLVTRLWIKAQNGPFNVRVGSQDLPEGAVTWSSVQAFDPATQKYLDFAVEGQAITVEFSASVPFRITGYKPELMVTSEF